MTPQPSDFSAAIERFTGFASLYNAYRPYPPVDLLKTLSRLAKTERPRLVVDLGCGTGLSTRPWADHADRIIGIDPSDDMRGVAQAETTASNIVYRQGFGHETGLADDCADIVTASSSLHWMEPVSTLAEVARILRPGGVFASYGSKFPPTTPAWEVQSAYAEFKKKADQLEEKYQVEKDLKRWHQSEVLGNLEKSGLFRFITEIYFHQTLQLTADYFIGWVLSQGGIESLLKSGVTESEMGLDALRAEAQAALGSEPKPYLFSYCVRLGIV